MLLFVVVYNLILPKQLFLQKKANYFAMSDQTQKDDEPHISSGGLIRNIPKMFWEIFRKFGSVQSTLVPHPRVVAKSAENISSVIEIRDTFKSSVESLSQTSNHTDDTKKKSTNNNYKWKKYLVFTQHFVPTFAKSTIGGTIVFSVYDFVFNKLLHNLYVGARVIDGGYGNDMYSVEGDNNKDMMRRYVLEHSTAMRSDVDSFGKALSFGVIAGTTGGLCNGLFSVSWDNCGSAIKELRKGCFTFRGWQCKPSPVVIGTVVSYSIVNGALFSSYDSAKYCSRYVFNKYQYNFNGDMVIITKPMFYYQLVVDVVKIFGCGFFAGTVSEIVAHYTAPLEEGFLLNLQSPRTFVRAVLSRPLPSPGSMTFSALTTSLGFLAYEYGKLEYAD